MAALRTGLLGCLVWGVLLPPALGADPTVRLSADIGPRPLSEALAIFGHQTGLQLIYVSSVAETRQSKGAGAGLTASAALTKLLDGTGLAFEFLNTRTVRIFPASAAAPAYTTSSSAAPPQRADSRAPELEQVVVTGTRGQEPLSRVPIAMTVWTEEAMDASHVRGIGQITALTPGTALSFAPFLHDEFTYLVIRGVADLHGPAVAVYVDDTPLPPSRAATYLATYPLTFDVDRVEILQGPQTVLLGDHALGGAIRFTGTQPSLTTSSARLRAEWGTTEYGGTSYEAGAAVGGPIAPGTLGFRLSGWFRDEGGYVDRVNPFDSSAVLDADSNWYLNKVVRGALTLIPGAGVQVTPSLMYQSIYIHDFSAYVTTLSDPQHGVFRYPALQQQPWSESYYLASLNLTARLRDAELRATTSYFDQTGSLLTTQNAYPYANLAEAKAMVLYGLDQHTYLADVRLTSLDPDARLTWIAGAFASREHANYPYQGMTLVSNTTATDQTQIAGFGQVEVQVTKHLNASTGLRIGRWMYNTNTASPPAFHARDSDEWAAPRFGLSWQANEHTLLYLDVAKGYGSGGVYPQTAPVGDTPGPYPPAALWSYEIGSKQVLLDERLHFETSVFHINWNNGPPNANLINRESYAVPGTAVSNGFGITTEALIGDHAKAALNIAYVEAQYSQTLMLNNGDLVVRTGDGVPVPPWNVTASVEREFLLPGGRTLNVRVEDAFRSAIGYSYRDDAATVEYAGFPEDRSVNVLNLRTALRWSDCELAAFLTNALNSHPALSLNGGGTGTAPIARTLTPRTLSVSGT